MPLSASTEPTSAIFAVAVIIGGLALMGAYLLMQAIRSGRPAPWLAFAFTVTVLAYAFASLVLTGPWQAATILLAALAGAAFFFMGVENGGVAGGIGRLADRRYWPALGLLALGLLVGFVAREPAMETAALALVALGVIWCGWMVLDAPRPAPPPSGTPVTAARGESLAERYALGLAAAHEGLWDWTIRGDRLYFSDSVERMMGMAPGTLPRREEAFAARVHPEDYETYRNALASYVKMGDVSFDLDFRLRHEDGGHRWFQLRASCLPGEEGMAHRVIGVISDVSHARGQLDRSVEDTLHDALTGLPNRALVIDRLSRALERVADGQEGPALLHIDIDRFRAVNDALGHVMGDQLLVAIARRVGDTLEKGETLGRLGGDDFALVMPQADEAAAMARAEAVHQALGGPVMLDGQEMFPAASIGIALARPGQSAVGDLLREAEVAMYHAKRRGKARTEVYHSTIKVHGGAMLALDTDLRRALEKEEIDIVYQPIVALRDGSIAGFETLMRWHRGESGTLAPDRFVSLAEETGMILPLGRFVLARAARELNAWQAAGGGRANLFLSVNLSSRQLFDHDLAAEVRSIFDVTPVRPGSLRLEVTESIIMENPERAARMLRRLKEMGCALALDDFGTGFSSFSYLQRFPVDILKIDRSFVSMLRGGNESVTIVRAMVNLAHDLGMIAVAEGVEAEEEARILRDMTCDYAQGFLFGPPLPAGRAAELVAGYMGR